MVLAKAGVPDHFVGQRVHPRPAMEGARGRPGCSAIRFHRLLPLRPTQGGQEKGALAATS